MDIILNCCLNHPFGPIGECSTQSLLEKLLCVEDGGYGRNSQLVKVQRVSVACSAADDVFTPISPKVKGPSQKMDQKECKNQKVGKIRANQCLPDMSGPQHS